MIHYYCFHKTRQIIVSDLPVEKIRKKYGHEYEILTSVKEKSSVEVINERTARSYSKYIITEDYLVIKKRNTEKAVAAAILATKGKPRSEEVKRKISLKLKGRGRFTGKKHRPDSKQKTSEAMKGNTNSKDLYWVYDPNSDYETRIKNREDLPPGMKFGRDYYSTEAISMFKSTTRSPTNSPKEK
ncbi:MAG: NUMOD3 domain-containing DNA-binding protein [Minisyncoccia bacterium]